MNAQNPLLTLLLASLHDAKAIDVTIIDVSLQTTITDYMVVCTGRSSRHVKAVAEHLILDLKAKGWHALNHQGLSEGEWALVDFGDVVVHIMQQEIRTFYNLEELWQSHSQG